MRHTITHITHLKPNKGQPHETMWQYIFLKKSFYIIIFELLKKTDDDAEEEKEIQSIYINSNSIFRSISTVHVLVRQKEKQNSISIFIFEKNKIEIHQLHSKNIPDFSIFHSKNTPLFFFCLSSRSIVH